MWRRPYDPYFMLENGYCCKYNLSMSKERFFPFDVTSGGDEGIYINPNPGIYDRVRVKPPQFYEGADTASPKIEGNRTTRGVQSRALVIHPEFPATDAPQFS